MTPPDPKYLVILSGVTFAGLAAWAAWSLAKFKEPWVVAGEAPAPAEEAPKASKTAAKTKAAPVVEEPEEDEDDEEEEETPPSADEKKSTKDA